MKNTSNSLLTTGLSMVLGISAAVSGVTLWTLISQPSVVHADDCSGACSNPNGDQYCTSKGGNGCVCAVQPGGNGFVCSNSSSG